MRIKRPPQGGVFFDLLVLPAQPKRGNGLNLWFSLDTHGLVWLRLTLVGSACKGV